MHLYQIFVPNIVGAGRDVMLFTRVKLIYLWQKNRAPTSLESTPRSISSWLRKHLGKAAAALGELLQGSAGGIRGHNCHLKGFINALYHAKKEPFCPHGKQ